MWTKISCPEAELCLDKVLRNGQSFRWRSMVDSSPVTYQGVVGRYLVQLRRSCPSYIEYSVLATVTPEAEVGSDQPKLKKRKRDKVKKDADHLSNIHANNDMTDAELIKDYLNLHVNLEELYKSWMARDPVFDRLMKCDKGKQYNGIRILRQHPVECLFSFICSANNNIKRISGMVEKLCVAYGTKGMYQDEPFYAFPNIEALAPPEVEVNLRKLGFGYRAKYIVQTAQRLLGHGNGVDWLFRLRGEEYDTAKKELLSLAGVGPKVADCVCLMCLDKHCAVPVDTHVRQVTAKYYMPKLTNVNTVTNKIYKEIGDKYAELFGGYAGWAHSVLFSMDLKIFD